MEAATHVGITAIDVRLRGVPHGRGSRGSESELSSGEGLESKQRHVLSCMNTVDKEDAS